MMTVRELVENAEIWLAWSKFWALLVLYTVLAPLWLFCAYARRRDRAEAVVMVILGLYCGANAVGKWMDV
jgi:hypothetical protein